MLAIYPQPLETIGDPLDLFSAPNIQLGGLFLALAVCRRAPPSIPALFLEAPLAIVPRANDGVLSKSKHCKVSSEAMTREINVV